VAAAVLASWWIGFCRIGSAFVTAVHLGAWSDFSIACLMSSTFHQVHGIGIVERCSLASLTVVDAVEVDCALSVAFLQMGFEGVSLLSICTSLPVLLDLSA
jgi:hypothetical protein